MRTKTVPALLAVAAMTAASWSIAAPVGAATYTVTNSNDSGADSFRQAVIDANGDPGSTVDFADGLAPIILASPVEITADMTIAGNGKGVTVLGGGADAVLRIPDSSADVDVTVRDLSIDDADDNAIEIRAAEGPISLTLERVAVTGSGNDGVNSDNDDQTVNLTVVDSELNDGAEGDGIDMESTEVATNNLTILRSTLSDNGDDGVDVEHASATVTDTTMDGNVDDGIVLEVESQATIVGSTFTNTGDDGIDLQDGSSGTVVNSTSSLSGESGIDVDDAGPLTVTNSTFVGSQEHGIDLTEADGITVTNSIMFDNAVGDCQGAFTSGGGNIDGDGTCGLAAEGDQPETDPLLGALADNGGPTQTHLPQEGSPAIDTALAAPCPGDDQRDVARPQDGDDDGTTGCDVGSVEVAGVGEEPPPTDAPTPSTPTPTSPRAAPVVAQPTFTG